MRLDKRSRKKILIKLLVHRFEPAAKTLSASIAELANDVYDNVYSASFRKTMAELPDGWLPESKGLKVQFGATMAELNFSGGTVDGRIMNAEESRKRMPYQHHNEWYYRCLEVYDANHHLSVRWSAIESVQTDLTNMINDAENNINAMLNSTTTTEGLVAKWPEVEPFLTDLGGTVKHVPAVQTEKLNKMLDLPVS